MTFNYQVVLFKNKLKKRIINKFKTLKKAELYFNNLISESNNVIFPKKFENGSECNHEIALLEKKSSKDETIYIKDEMGRQIKVELDDDSFTIKKVFQYQVEEEFVEYKSKTKLTSKDFIKKYLNSDGLKMLSKLNNKIILQNEDNINLFTFKNNFDSDRFIEIMSEKFNRESRLDCLLVKDSSNSQRKYLYNLLVDNGFPKSYLQRHSTTHPVKK